MRVVCLRVCCRYLSVVLGTYLWKTFVWVFSGAWMFGGMRLPATYAKGSRQKRAVESIHSTYCTSATGSEISAASDVPPRMFRTAATTTSHFVTESKRQTPNAAAAATVPFLCTPYPLTCFHSTCTELRIRQSGFVYGNTLLYRLDFCIRLRSSDPIIASAKPRNHIGPVAFSHDIQIPTRSLHLPPLTFFGGVGEGTP